ncbi:UDP-glucose 6-dehydrogenase [Bifidobacterium aemilianum]|uniref:UDP-glucose 6-dehydrogenase n=1 Tax=Bifidobacterium aemilianum TaxID=2493120 RepID=A0A366KB82_9BIFI|nr:nucleotide sugar dehydrogenase [Bifidobacterium aemilianum]RBP98502.1 UDP-glucose 6-dehydrogenase [Bifidobacterium aemilianum]
MKIAVAGTGYVGLSVAVLLAQNNEVHAVDIVQEKVALINDDVSPIRDTEISTFLANDKSGRKPLNLHATTDMEHAYRDASFVVISTPTNYDPSRNYFDTSSVEDAIRSIRSVNTQAWIVIKSTVPVGYTNHIRHAMHDDHIIFSPEFLRESKALYDNLHPSRIVIGTPEDDSEAHEAARVFGQLLTQGADPAEQDRTNPDGSQGIPILLVGTTEAEAIKLFSNSYLAMRISYFNELDTYALSRHLNSRDIIRGVGMDPRIGSHYNNPSFGYGGYCLPKDSKQLLANYDQVPQKLISAIVESNQTRKDFIAQEIIERARHRTDPKVGVYRLIMKQDSDNFRESAIQDVIRRITEAGVPITIFEPTFDGQEFLGCKVVSDLEEFLEASDIILANRWNKELSPAKDKVYTRDLFGLD